MGDRSRVCLPFTVPYKRQRSWFLAASFVLSAGAILRRMCAETTLISLLVWRRDTKEAAACLTSGKGWRSMALNTALCTSTIDNEQQLPIVLMALKFFFCLIEESVRHFTTRAVRRKEHARHSTNIKRKASPKGASSCR